MKIMKLTNKLSALVVIFSMIATSCGDTETEAIFTGVQVHFVTDNSASSYLFDGTPGVLTDDPVPITLVGAAQSEDVTITIEVSDESTAVEGVHYNLSSTTVTIPAGSFTGDIDVVGILDGFGGDPTDRRTLEFTIASSSAPVAINANSLTHTIGITCPSDLGGEVSYTITSAALDDGAGTTGTAADLANSGTFNWTDQGDGVYRWDSYTFGGYQFLYGCCEQEGASILEFTEVCNNLEMAAADGFACAWSITVDDVTGATLTATVTGECLGSYTIEMTRSDGEDWPALF